MELKGQGFGGWVIGFGVKGSGFWGLGYRVWSYRVRVLGSELWGPELWVLAGVLGAGGGWGGVISVGVLSEFCGPGWVPSAAVPYRSALGSRALGFRAPVGCCCRPGSAPRAAGKHRIRADLCGDGTGHRAALRPHTHSPIDGPIDGPVPHNPRPPPRTPLTPFTPPSLCPVLCPGRVPWGGRGGGNRWLSESNAATANIDTVGCREHRGGGVGGLCGRRGGFEG